ncbi:hypothetical protein HMPREF2533_02087 [Bacteroides fragilis]|nr:hypothetical protein HMPREF2530_02087 [Bacteroides fragilis]KXU46284.1 hypothetical protein HMPREF2533_02087 [Bacteroides fragilis]
MYPVIQNNKQPIFLLLGYRIFIRCYQKYRLSQLRNLNTIFITISMERAALRTTNI